MPQRIACNRCHEIKPTVAYYSGIGLNLCLECAKIHNGLGNLTINDSVQLASIHQVSGNKDIVGSVMLPTKPEG